MFLSNVLNRSRSFEFYFWVPTTHSGCSSPDPYHQSTYLLSLSIAEHYHSNIPILSQKFKFSICFITPSPRSFLILPTLTSPQQLTQDDTNTSPTYLLTYSTTADSRQPIYKKSQEAHRHCMCDSLVLAPFLHLSSFEASMWSPDNILFDTQERKQENPQVKVYELISISHPS